MIYWTSPSGTIFRAESENSDMVAATDQAFAAPFAFNAIVGSNLFEFIGGAEISHLYQALSARVIKTGLTVNFAYRCDGPGTRREMSMQLSRDGEMVRYESSLIRETLRERPIPSATSDAEVFVALCCFCQNYRFPVSSNQWKELEDLLMEDGLPGAFQFTHGICEGCLSTVMRAAEQ